MAEITLDLVKQLREKTQVGMMDCRKALEQANGDMEKAIEILRIKGASVAAKRADHATNNGTISAYISADNKNAALIAMSCETDFAANTADMQAFAKAASEQAALGLSCEGTDCDVAKLLEQPLASNKGRTLKMHLDELMAKISENIKLARAAHFKTDANGLINVYIHPGSMLGTMIDLQVTGLSAANTETIKELAKDLCMHIAVTNPMCIDPSQLDKAFVEKEEAIAKEQMKDSNKPASVMEKIIAGKLNKTFEEVCLLKQKYIKQDKTSIDQHVKEVAQKANCTITIKRFARFAIGK